METEDKVEAPKQVGEMYIFNDEDNMGVSVKTYDGGFTQPRVYYAGNTAGPLTIDEATILAVRFAILRLQANQFDVIYTSNERIVKLVSMEEVLEDSDKLLPHLIHLQDELSTNNLQLKYIAAEDNPAKFKTLDELHPSKTDKPTAKLKQKKVKKSA